MRQSAKSEGSREQVWYPHDVGWHPSVGIVHIIPRCWKSLPLLRSKLWRLGTSNGRMDVASPMQETINSAVFWDLLRANNLRRKHLFSGDEKKSKEENTACSLKGIVFSCKGTALEMLRYVCLWSIWNSKLPEGFKRFQKVPEGPWRSLKVPVCSFLNLFESFVLHASKQLQ